MAELKCEERCKLMPEEEHEGDLEDSWKERILEMLPSMKRVYVDPSDVCLEEVCD